MGLKFWFDVLTPKQVKFFKPIVDELKNRNHKVLCTSRKYREVEELAALKNMELTKVGEYGGDTLYGKIRKGLERSNELINTVQDFDPDCLVSFSSPDACRIAFGLQIRNIGFNDSPHAEAVCRLSIPLMNRLICPWIIPYVEFTRYGITRQKIQRYKALDPAVWIKNGVKRIYKHQDLNLDSKRKTITFRFEETKAAYIYGDTSFSSSLLRSLIDNFSDCNIVVLCRYMDQLKSVTKEFGDSTIVLDKVVDGTALLLLSELFIGSGGTMNCEASLLGIPNLSYNMQNIVVNKFLIGRAVSKQYSSVDDTIRYARIILTNENTRKSIAENSKRLLAQMEDPKEKILKMLEQVN